MRSSVLTIEKEDAAGPWMVTIPEHEGTCGSAVFCRTEKLSDAVHMDLVDSFMGLHCLNGFIDGAFWPDRDIEENDIKEDRKHE